MIAMEAEAAASHIFSHFKSTNINDSVLPNAKRLCSRRSRVGRRGGRGNGDLPARPESKCNKWNNTWNPNVAALLKKLTKLIECLSFKCFHWEVLEHVTCRKKKLLSFTRCSRNWENCWSLPRPARRHAKSARASQVWHTRSHLLSPAKNHQKSTVSKNVSCWFPQTPPQCLGNEFTTIVVHVCQRLPGWLLQRKNFGLKGGNWWLCYVLHYEFLNFNASWTFIKHGWRLHPKTGPDNLVTFVIHPMTYDKHQWSPLRNSPAISPGSAWRSGLGSPVSMDRNGEATHHSYQVKGER